MIESDQQRLTQHKMFVPDGTYPNPSLTLRTSFMLKPMSGSPQTALKCAENREANLIVHDLHARARARFVILPLFRTKN